MSKIFVSGVGVFTPVGRTADDFWSSLVSGQTHIAEAASNPGSGILVSEIAQDDVPESVGKARALMCDKSALIGAAAARDAISDAGLDLQSINLSRVAVIVGNGGGGLHSLHEQYKNYYEGGVERPSPLTVSKVMNSSTASWISMTNGFMGPTFVVTSACASGNHAIGVAAQILRSGLADVVISGGIEACLSFSTVLAWASIGVLTEDVCRPFSRNRDGILLSEGAGVLVLETEEHLAQRGGRALAELCGFGFCADAGNLTAPDTSGMSRAMALCLSDAGVNAQDVSYVNAHGTGTQINDVKETEAIKAVFGDITAPPVSSTKSVTGHALGAAGGIEGVATVLAIKNGFLPPTAHLSDPDPECDLDYIPNDGRPADVKFALSNAFAFGGLNACVLFGAPP